MIDIIFWIFAAYMLFLVLGAAIVYWQVTLFIIGVIIVNVFTFWSAAGIFALGISVQVHEHTKNKTLTTKILVNEIILNSAKVTTFVVVTALLLNIVVQSLGGGSDIPCSRATPHGC